MDTLNLVCQGWLIFLYLILMMDMLMSYIMMLKVNVCILGAMAYSSVFTT